MKAELEADRSARVDEPLEVVEFWWRERRGPKWGLPCQRRITPGGMAYMSSKSVHSYFIPRTGRRVSVFYGNVSDQRFQPIQLTLMTFSAALLLTFIAPAPDNICNLSVGIKFQLNFMSL